MDVELETTADPGPDQLWVDADGFAGGLQPGTGPRRNPRGEFPTCPEVGERLPDIVAQTPDGEVIDVHRDRAGQAAAVVFYRSAVW